MKNEESLFLVILNESEESVGVAQLTPVAVYRCFVSLNMTGA